MNVKQLKSQSLLQEALQEALCELGDTRLRNLTITKVELSAGKESAKVFLDENSLDGAESARILSALKKASGAIRANIGAQLSWYKVPSLRFEVDRELAQMNRLESIFKKIHAKENAESSLNSANLSPLNSLDSSRKKCCTPRPAPPTRQKATAFSLLGGEPRFSASSKKSVGGTTAPFDSDFLHHEAGEFSGASHETFLDSANLSNSQNLIKNNPLTNSSIVDEFLGLCEASDKDRTKVHRGSEPKHSLKSRHKTNLTQRTQND